MPTPGYAASVYGFGDLVQLVGEPLSGSGTTWQLNTSQRAVDPVQSLSGAIVVKDNGVVVPSSQYTIDYLFGVVTFATSRTGPITLDGDVWENMYPALYIKEATFRVERDILDMSTLLDGEGYKVKTVGLKSASGTITTLQMLPQSFSETTPYGTLFDAGTPFLLEIRPSDIEGTQWFRAWVVFDTGEEKINPAALGETTLNWVSVPVTGTGRTDSATFGFGVAS
jgi:hypothetical protein